MKHSGTPEAVGLERTVGFWDHMDASVPVAPFPVHTQHWTEYTVGGVGWMMDYPYEWYYLAVKYKATGPVWFSGYSDNMSHAIFRFDVPTTPRVLAIDNQDVYILGATSDASGIGGERITVWGYEDTTELVLGSFKRPFLGAATEISAAAEARFSTGVLDGERTFVAVSLEVVPAADAVSVQIIEWPLETNVVRRWVETADGQPGPVAHLLVGLAPAERYTILTNDTVWRTATADGSGTLAFDYGGAFPVTFAVTDDHDADGIPDSEDPDDDNDGMSDEDEAIAGTDPFDHESLFRISALSLQPSALSLLFESATGRLYDVLYKDSLLGTNDWLPLTNDWPGDGGTMEFTAPAGATQRFYRVEVRLEE